MNTQAALRIIEEICNTQAVAGNPADMAAGRLTDAHTYTRTLIRNDYPRLLAIDEEFIHQAATSNMLNFVLVHQEIMAYAAAENYEHMPQLTEIMNIIRTFVDGPQHGYEGDETHINVGDLLWRCWALAKANNDHYVHSGVLTQILTCLSGNIIDQGGCIPGVIARLYPAYARLLQAELQYIEQQPAAALLFLQPTIAEPVDAEDEDLQLALALSRSLQFTRY